MQQKVFGIFHYALRADGCLVLGSAASTGPQIESAESEIDVILLVIK